MLNYFKKQKLTFCSILLLFTSCDRPKILRINRIYYEHLYYRDETRRIKGYTFSLISKLEEGKLLIANQYVNDTSAKLAIDKLDSSFIIFNDSMAIIDRIANKECLYYKRKDCWKTYGSYRDEKKDINSFSTCYIGDTIFTDKNWIGVIEQPISIYRFNLKELGYSHDGDYYIYYSHKSNVVVRKDYWDIKLRYTDEVIVVEPDFRYDNGY